MMMIRYQSFKVDSKARIRAPLLLLLLISVAPNEALSGSAVNATGLCFDWHSKEPVEVNFPLSTFELSQDDVLVQLRESMHTDDGDVFLRARWPMGRRQRKLGSELASAARDGRSVRWRWSRAARDKMESQGYLAEMESLLLEVQCLRKRRGGGDVERTSGGGGRRGEVLDVIAFRINIREEDLCRANMQSYFFAQIPVGISEASAVGQLLSPPLSSPFERSLQERCGLSTRCAAEDETDRRANAKSGPQGKVLEVDPASGRLRLNRPLDRETRPRIEQRLVCNVTSAVDGAAVAASVSSKLVVTVLDVDDHLPFTKEFGQLERDGSSVVVVYSNKDTLRKGTELSLPLFHDRDLPHSSHYRLSFLDDAFRVTEDFLSPEHQAFLFDLCGPGSAPNCSSHEGAESIPGNPKVEVTRGVDLPHSARAVISDEKTGGEIIRFWLEIRKGPDEKKVEKATPDVWNGGSEEFDEDGSRMNSSAKYLRLTEYSPKYTRLLSDLNPDWMLAVSCIAFVGGGSHEEWEMSLADSPYRLTEDKTILFLDNPFSLGSFAGSRFKFYAQDHDGSRIELLSAEVAEASEGELTCPSPVAGSDSELWCAELDDEHDCAAACVHRDHGQAGMTCSWVRSPLASFSSCSGDPEFCPDQRCDQLEALSGGCPQDCVTEDDLMSYNKGVLSLESPPGQFTSPLERLAMMKRSENESNSEMICFCHNKSPLECTCSDAQKYKIEQSTDFDYYDDAEETWGTHKVPIIITVPVLSILIVGSIFIRRRCFPSQPSPHSSNPLVKPLSPSAANSGFMTTFLRLSTGYIYGGDGSDGHAAGQGSNNGGGGEGDAATAAVTAALIENGGGGATSGGGSLNTFITAMSASSSFVTGDQLGAPFLYIDKKWEIPRESLSLKEIIGEGEFGRVLSGTLKSDGKMGEVTEVAVKMLKSNHSPQELHDLVGEYHHLKEMDHPNVIKLLGACTEPGGPLLIVMEFARHGSLRGFLRRSRGIVDDGGSGSCNSRQSAASNTASAASTATLSASVVAPRDVLSFAWQVAKGMNYLADMKLVHRDLAARNVLLAEGMVCKVSDFGLMRDIYMEETYTKRSNGRIPVKWLAPESLRDHLYTTRSDVWSFGILLWELTTLGSSPYPGVAPERLLELLANGYRMTRPQNCPEELYNIMCHCWQLRPDDRPTFGELTCWLERLLHRDTGWYLDLNPAMVNNATYLRPISCSISANNFQRQSSSFSCGSTPTEEPPPSSLPLLRELSAAVVTPEDESLSPPAQKAPRPPPASNKEVPSCQHHRRRHRKEAEQIRRKQKEASELNRSKTITLPMLERRSGSCNNNELRVARPESVVHEELKLLQHSVSLEDPNKSPASPGYSVTYSRLASATDGKQGDVDGQSASSSSKLRATPV